MEQKNSNQNTALLVMDVQEATVSRLKEGTSLIDAVNQSIQTARNNNIPVIYAVIAFRSGYPEVSPNNKSFLALQKGTVKFDTEKGASVHPSVMIQPGDIVVTKKRVSAFTGSDLEVVLRSHQVNHLVLSGIATGGVVLSTLREAADKDFILTVLSDCCADTDEEVHRVLTTKVFPRQAQVLTVAEWRDKGSGR